MLLYIAYIDPMGYGFDFEVMKIKSRGLFGPALDQRVAVRIESSRRCFHFGSYSYTSYISLPEKMDSKMGLVFLGPNGELNGEKGELNQ
jgi:hypothetical protein